MRTLRVDVDFVRVEAASSGGSDYEKLKAERDTLLDRLARLARHFVQDAVLRDGLESIDSDELVLKLISPLRPGLIESPDTGDFVYLIMPIRLNV